MYSINTTPKVGIQMSALELIEKLKKGDPELLKRFGLVPVEKPKISVSEISTASFRHSKVSMGPLKTKKIPLPGRGVVDNVVIASKMKYPSLSDVESLDRVTEELVKKLVNQKLLMKTRSGYYDLQGVFYNINDPFFKQYWNFNRGSYYPCNLPKSNGMRDAYKILREICDNYVVPVKPFKNLPAMPVLDKAHVVSSVGSCFRGGSDTISYKIVTLDKVNNTTYAYYVGIPGKVAVSSTENLSGKFFSYGFAQKVAAFLVKYKTMLLPFLFLSGLDYHQKGVFDGKFFVQNRNLTLQKIKSFTVKHAMPWAYFRPIEELHDVVDDHLCSILDRKIVVHPLSPHYTKDVYLNKICKTVSKRCGKFDCILDGFAGSGHDSLIFMKSLGISNVIAAEANTEIRTIFRHNYNDLRMKVFNGVESSVLYLRDLSRPFKRVLYYFDPPFNFYRAEVKDFFYKSWVFVRSCYF
jgi:hypothetical protein